MKHEDQSTRQSTEAETTRLWSDANWALERGLGLRDVVPMLQKLIRRATPGSDAWRFGLQELAEQLLEAAPWRALLAVKRLIREGETDRAWAVAGLAYTLLGHHHAAIGAYRRALRLSPGCPEYSHNLGHLLDVALDRPRDALGYLQAAHRGLPHNEIAASYAHALVRLDRVEDARRLLSRKLSGGARAADALLARWTVSLASR